VPDDHHTILMSVCISTKSPVHNTTIGSLVYIATIRSPVPLGSPQDEVHMLPIIWNFSYNKNTGQIHSCSVIPGINMAISC
jgi:hypothetical protein